MESVCKRRTIESQWSLVEVLAASLFLALLFSGNFAHAMDAGDRSQVLERVCKIRTERSDAFSLPDIFPQMPATSMMSRRAEPTSENIHLEFTHLEAVELTLQQKCLRCHSPEGEQYAELRTGGLNPAIFDGYASLIQFTEPPYFERSRLYQVLVEPVQGQSHYEFHQNLEQVDDGAHLRDNPETEHLHIGGRWLDVFRIWLQAGAPDNTGNLCNPVMENLGQCDMGKIIYRRLCTQCHGINGVSQKVGVPSLASVSGNALSAHLYNLRNDWRRPHPEKGLPQRMIEIARYELNPEEIEAVSQYIALFPSRSELKKEEEPAQMFTAEEIEAAVRGHEIFNDKRNDCNGCHTPIAVGREEIGRTLNHGEYLEFRHNCRVFPMPSLLGHPPSYIRNALCDLANARRGGLSLENGEVVDRETSMFDTPGEEGTLCETPQITSRLMIEQIRQVLRLQFAERFSEAELNAEIMACDGQLQMAEDNQGQVTARAAGDHADEVFNDIAQYLRVLSVQVESSRNPERRSLPQEAMTCPGEEP